MGCTDRTGRRADGVKISCQTHHYMIFMFYLQFWAVWAEVAWLAGRCDWLAANLTCLEGKFHCISLNAQWRGVLKYPLTCFSGLARQLFGSEKLNLATFEKIYDAGAAAPPPNFLTDAYCWVASNGRITTDLQVKTTLAPSPQT